MPWRRLPRWPNAGPGPWLGACGPVLTLSTACASGATILGIGADLLRSGRPPWSAGGVDVLCRLSCLDSIICAPDA